MLAALLLLACQHPSQQLPTASTNKSVHVIEAKPLRYARNFGISQLKATKRISVFTPWKGMNDTLHYELGSTPSDASGIGTFIQTPVNSVVCLSTTHLAYLAALDLHEMVIGAAGTEWINDSLMAERINAGKIRNIGRDQQLNYETIVDLNPDLVFVFGVNASSMQTLKKLEELGVQSVVVSEYMEHHPLGKAEWIKFFAAFFGVEEQADTLFSAVAERYLHIADLAGNVEHRPTVFTGLPWKGDWFVPGGKSFQATLFHDAGAAYLWADNTETSGTVVDIEVVIERALDADYWLNVNDVESLKEIAAADMRYSEFKAYSNRQVFNNNKEKNQNNGNDYWESGVVRPDRVLMDLVTIFHPGILPHHQLYYYQQLD